MALSSAERQRAFRARKSAEGVTYVTLAVPARHVGDLQILASRLCTDPDLEVGNLRNARTGRLEKLFKPV